jgi:DNA-binding NarL/FixJ family response regulator
MLPAEELFVYVYVKFLILTTFEDDEYIAQAPRAGASGFLGKGAVPADLLRAIRVVTAGEALLSPAATKGLIARCPAQPAATPEDASRRLDALTPCERESMALAATGLSHDIAKKLFSTPSPPVLAIVITILGFNLLADGLRDLLDPRLRSRS